MSGLKCPKCGCRDMTLTESVLIFESRSVVAGKVSRQVDDSGPITSKGWTATCSECDHQWRPRDSTVEAARNAT